MKRPTLIEVDVAAFERNLAAVRQMLPADSRLIAVLKADAYGHGAVPLARSCSRHGVSMIAVSLLEEALELHEEAIDIPMLILGPLTESQIAGAADHGFVVGIAGPEMLDAAIQVARDCRQPLRIHLKLDSGMGRMGLVDDEIDNAISSLSKASNLSLEAIYSHYATASDRDHSHLRMQQRAFRKMIDKMRGAGVEAPNHHFANSAATVRREITPGDFVRVGMLLYGGEPMDQGTNRLEPIMRWSTRIARLKTLPPGSSVGYGATFKTPRESRIATIPVGYADGYLWALSNKAEVLVGGRRAPVVGRVSMDLVTIDVTDIPEAQMGDEVVLLGRQGDEIVTAEELAAHAGTIPYEIFCSVGARVPRVVI